MNSSTERNDRCESRETCEFQQNIDVFRQIAFFAGLPLEPLKVLAYLAERTTFKPGECLFHEGEADGQAFYILSGRARLERSGDGAGTKLTSYGPGDFLGGLALLGDMQRLFSLCAESEVEAMVVTREKFAKTLAQFPEIQSRLMENVVDLVRDWEKSFFFDHAGACQACAEHIGVSLV
ncbi:putative transcriptional regulator, Crp/Fnr family [Alkalidesulfovibrio alkalitolerans DSM 16529]|jgi:CRP-like cAMP-binding protein|uniref:Putative transcriptional regulator, Crp/Fnr family n=1 Tax=Alkalidesulfovibrio alkalitolerans DSM 16529 TaxID=1121439 RepID=S7UFH5_9BACT|nr:Crp/Fnr family transcriptional regulator [Alkalidesulfovibrio alkalitolerans]EPR30973.1 putative transcriptional regulator, Crp/Fnr family [Alkalidesulfovibrio alkalitolerans DSM 16529]